MVVNKHKTKTYLAWIGILQAMAITLVVLGHSLPIDDVSKNPLIVQVIRNVIYSFHIPLFFSISGYLFWYTNTHEKIGYNRFVLKKAVQLLVPYVVVGFLMYVPKYYLNTFSAHPVELSWLGFVRSIIFPLEHAIRFYWYLPTLFIMFLFAPIYTKIVTHKQVWMHIIVLALLSVLSIWRVPIKLFNISGVSTYLVYFYAGILFCIHYEWISHFYRKKWLNILLLILFIAGNFFFWSTSPAGRWYFLYEYLLAGIGLFLSYSFVYLYEKYVTFFLKISPYTFMIYLWSLFPQVLVKIRFQTGILPYWVAVAGMFAGGILVPIMMSLLWKRVNNTVYPLVKRNTSVVFLLGVTITSFILFTYKLGKESFWLDEALTYGFSKDIVPHTMSVLATETNMLFYFFIMHFWMYLGTSEFVMRFLSVIFGVAGVIAIYFLGREVKDTKTGMIAAILLMINTFFIQYAQEARPYTMFVFFFIVTTFLMYRLGRKFEIKKAVLYVLLSIIAVYSHIFAVLFIGCQLCYLLWSYRKDMRNISTVVFAYMVIGLCLIPLLFFSKQTSGIAWIQRPNFHDIYGIYEAFSSSSKVILILFLALIVFDFFRNRTKEKNKTLYWYLIGVSFFTVFLLFIVSILKPIFVSRYFLYALPAFLMLVASAITDLKKKELLVGTLCLIALLHLNTIRLYYSSSKKEDWRGVVQTINQKASRNDQIIVFPSYLYRPFSYYSNRDNLKNNQITVLKENLDLANSQQIDESLNRIPANLPQKSLWVVKRKVNMPKLRDTQKQALDKKIQSVYNQKPKKYSFEQLEVDYYSAIQE